MAEGVWIILFSARVIDVICCAFWAVELAEWYRVCGVVVGVLALFILQGVYGRVRPRHGSGNRVWCSVSAVCLLCACIHFFLLMSFSGCVVDGVSNCGERGMFWQLAFVVHAEGFRIAFGSVISVFRRARCLDCGSQELTRCPAHTRGFYPFEVSSSGNEPVTGIGA